MHLLVKNLKEYKMKKMQFLHVVTIIITVASQVLLCTSGHAITADVYGGYFKTLTGRKNTLHVYESTHALSEVKCISHCLQNYSCNTYNFNRHLSSCELSRSLDVPNRLETGEGIIDSVESQDWSIGYRQLDQNFCSGTLPPMENSCSSAPCQNEAVSCEPKLCNRDFHCTCSTGYSGTTCEIHDCPDGFTLRFTSSCYKFVNESKKWQDAEDYCQSMDARAHLVALETQKEDDFLMEIINVRFWIGGNDIDYENDWRWIGTSGTVPPSGWSPNEPNNYNWNEDCMLNVPNLNWVDASCAGLYPFVCEIIV